MPPEIKTQRICMLDAAVQMVEESGWESVSARTLAARLGISTQPIYREFGDMAALKSAVTEHGFRIFSQYVCGSALEQAEKYVMFACDHGRLFNFLFRGSHLSYGGLDDLAHKLRQDADIIDKLSEVTGLDRETTYTLHLYIWMALHGLASFSADNSVQLNEGEVREFTYTMSRALSKYLREGEK